MTAVGAVSLIRDASYASYFGIQRYARATWCAFGSKYSSCYSFGIFIVDPGVKLAFDLIRTAHSHNRTLAVCRAVSHAQVEIAKTGGVRIRKSAMLAFVQ